MGTREYNVIEGCSGGVREVEILIRDIDPRFVKNYEEIAAKRGESRNVVLVRTLEKNAVVGEVAEMERKYQDLVEKVLVTLQHQNEVMRQVESLMNELMGDDE
ncbi:hypothetical protein [Listeria booriae]|uniref:hypothetical protein n=1 Tax=Listeria booriae TaxID=1552123 RepID=UPI00164EC43C|nr:hypothetical protein [Listeria booriae]MBC6301553.1 hypothetical protein [Listeria booriae]